MTEMEQKQLAFIHQAVAKMNLSADEYVDTQDGLIHCKNCRKPRLVLLTAMPGRPFALPRCQCSCQQKELERELQEKERVQKELRISHRRELGLPSQSLQHYTFSQDNGRNPLMRKASAYVKHWEKAYQTHTGLLLFGNVGTGKSFFAGCIANALLDKDIPVLMTNFPTLLNRLTGLSGEERSALIAELDDYALLILDDLGVERNTEFVLEQMFQIIDGRYRCCKPLTVTTNLRLAFSQCFT